jgi:hypothetical protein
VKRLSASGEEQDVDELEIKKLAQDGKLLKFSEFLLTVVKAADFYNRERPHRGVLKEWTGRPRPSEVTPYQCLMACYEEGWRPVKISEEKLDLAFLWKETRTIDRGRIHFRTAFADIYEHEALNNLEGQVTIRFDPLDPGWILIYRDGDRICRAEPVEYSSMKDMGLAKRKIEEKARLRKYFITEYHRLTSQVPDLVQYSAIPGPAVTARTTPKLLQEKTESENLSAERISEQIAADVQACLDFEKTEEAACVDVECPGRPLPIFEYPEDRAEFYLQEKKRGVKLSAENEKWLKDFLAKALKTDACDYWQIVMKTNGIEEEATLTLEQVG